MPTDDSTFSRRKVVAWVERESDAVAQVYRALQKRGDRNEIHINQLVGAGAMLQKITNAIASGEFDAGPKEYGGTIPAEAVDPHTLVKRGGTDAD